MQSAESNSDSRSKTEDVSSKLEDYINKLVKREGYVVYDVAKKTVRSLSGGSYGQLSEIDVKGKTEDGDKETNIFVKQIVCSQLPLTFDLAEVYKRENFIYTDLSKEINAFQDNENIPVAERYKFAKVFDDCNDEAIIIENLTARGFKTYSRMDVVNLEYAELAVKDLARLHGLSLAMEIKRHGYFEKKIKSMNCSYNFGERWFKYTHGICFFASQFLGEDLRKKVTSHLINAVNKYPSYMTDRSSVRTICHGDFRHNNIMVKEIDGKPTEVIAVDYQMTFFGNPVLDFIYFIFWGTDREFRRHHLEHLKQLYYQYLGTFLGYFNLEVEKVFPKKEFEREYEDKLDFGLMIAVFYLPFLFPPEDDVPKVTDAKDPTSKLAMNVDKKYGGRLRGIIDDFIQWGYL